MRIITNQKSGDKAVKPESIERQTKMSWATLLTKYEEVPSDFQSFFNSLRQNSEVFPFSIITPSYEGFMQRSTEMLVCLTSDDLFIANKNESSENALKFKLADILHVQFRTVLLESSLKITGYNSKNESVTVILRFNTVSDFLFKKIVKRIRLYSFSENVSDETALFDEFRSENYKFANFAQHCLLPGEKVTQLIWQSELLKSLFRFPLIFRHFFRRRVFPNHVLMLTDQELILISEDNHHTHDDRYGGIWEYIKLAKIRSISLDLDQDDILTLSVSLPNDQQIESRYLQTLQPELQTLVNNFKKQQATLNQ